MTEIETELERELRDTLHAVAGLFEVPAEAASSGLVTDEAPRAGIWLDDFSELPARSSQGRLVKALAVAAAVVGIGVAVAHVLTSDDGGSTPVDTASTPPPLRTEPFETSNLAVEAGPLHRQIIVAADTGFYSLGRDAGTPLLRSDEGADWTAVDPARSTLGDVIPSWAGGPGDGVLERSLDAAGSSVFVTEMVSFDGAGSLRVWSSLDGANWTLTEFPLPPSLAPLVATAQSPSSASLSVTAASPERLVIRVGGMADRFTPAVFTIGTDGTWAEVDDVDLAGVTALSWTGERFLGAASSGVLTSTDGLSWDLAVDADRAVVNFTSDLQILFSTDLGATYADAAPYPLGAVQTDSTSERMWRGPDASMFCGPCVEFVSQAALGHTHQYRLHSFDGRTWFIRELPKLSGHDAWPFGNPHASYAWVAAPDGAIIVYAADGSVTVLTDDN